MELIFALVGFNVATSLFTLFEVIRLENAINNVFNTLSTIEDEEEEGSTKAKTFM